MPNQHVTMIRLNGIWMKTGISMHFHCFPLNIRIAWAVATVPSLLSVIHDKTPDTLRPHWWWKCPGLETHRYPRCYQYLSGKEKVRPTRPLHQSVKLNSCHCHANMFWRLVVSNIKTRFWSSLQLRNQWSCKELVKGNHLPKPSSHGLAPVLPDRQVARDTKQICGGDTKPTMWGGVAQVRISSHHSSWQNQALNNSTVQYFSLTQQATQPMQPKDSKCISKKGSKLASPSASSGHTTSPRCGR